jgi:proteasome lid subunit RPN8/RPN11
VAPDCTASRDLLVIPHHERVTVAAYLRAHQLLVFADLHTHPGAAFLSLADRARPFSARPGFYAIVVPNFAIGEPLEGWRIYEAVPGDWEEVHIDHRIR